MQTAPSIRPALPRQPNRAAGRRAAVLNEQRLLVPPTLQGRVADRTAQLCAIRWPQRLWRHDASLWTSADEGRWLGWLNPSRQKATMRELLAPCARLRDGGRTDAVLLGMGGASLGAHVLSQVLGPAPGGLRLHVLDSTDPDQIRQLQSQVPIERSLYIVASKSGSTMETRLLARHFLERAARVDGPEQARARFCAITDAGTPLHRQALEQRWAAVFDGDPAIGGRYSVLSPFGMVPLALMGHDAAAFLREAEIMSLHCGPGAHSEPNDALSLGVLLGEAVIAGRNKVTFWASPELASFAEWLEQLLAESTGKEGRGLVPIHGEPPSTVPSYRKDRLFVVLRKPDTAPDDSHTRMAQKLAQAGHPVVFITLRSTRALAQEFYRWQYATAVCGTLLGVHPFDQPDVEATKARARGLLARGTDRAQAPAAPAAWQRYGSLRVDLGQARGAGGVAALESALQDWASGPEIDYRAILAYLPRNSRTQFWLCHWQRALRRHGAGAVAACFGPRYLHSCGQLHKGGPAGGAYLFLQVDADGRDDDGEGWQGLRACHAAEAQADLQELRSRGRRCIDVRFTAGLARGLADLGELLQAALRRQPEGRAPLGAQRWPLLRLESCRAPAAARAANGARPDAGARTAGPRSLQTPAMTASGA